MTISDLLVIDAPTRAQFELEASHEKSDAEMRRVFDSLERELARLIDSLEDE